MVAGVELQGGGPGGTVYLLQRVLPPFYISNAGYFSSNFFNLSSTICRIL